MVPVVGEHERLSTSGVLGKESSCVTNPTPAPSGIVNKIPVSVNNPR